MKAKKSGTIERMAHSFYLYPELTKPQNIIRGVAWSASWIISIFIPRLTQSDCSLGGAYIVFSIALLLEFISISRGSLLAQLTHGIFIALLVAMLPLLFPHFSIEELQGSIDCYIDYYNNERIRG